ncbi:MAG TPA: helicase-related protein [Dehalococcoidia bacterium]|nr:helicase-related protein [Dehalococcoidia bacterium]
MTTGYAVGSLVTARGRDWVVLPESSLTGAPDDLLVLRPLGGSDDDIAAVFPAFEDVSGALFAPPEPDDLGDAAAAGLLRSALRIGFRSGAGPLRSLAGIAVEPRPYQLVPLLMALRQETVRLLISDDVGIGKTVEAALIAAELLAQGDARGLAVLCSPALAEQWQAELRSKFGIDAELILASTVSRLERELDYGQSLFDRHRHVIVSTDFIKSPRHRDDFVAHCPDLVIVDEAHTCVAAGSLSGSTGQAASGSGRRQTHNQLRYELLRKVADDRSRHLLLVTATPHSGKDESFRALIGLLDPQLETLDLSGDAGRRRLANHFVQRRRADIRRYLGEDTEFPTDRLFKDETYKLSLQYRALLDDAIAYASERVTDATGRSRRDARIAWWSAIALLRSLVSSPRAAAQTLTTRSTSALAQTAQEADELGRPVIADLAEDDNLEGLDAAPGAETELTGASAWLKALAERAAQLEGPEHDLKLALLIKQLKALLADSYNPIVFCRYIPTAEYVAEQLEGKLGRKTVVRAVTGTLSPQQRLGRIEELAAETADDAAARRVLVATDCLSEGVNLQHHFDAIVHYDLAWNPTRHEQREGRVDRFGQRRPEVRVVTVYGSDNGIDGKVLEVLIKKHREIREATGISVPVPDETSAGVTDALVEWLLLRGESAARNAARGEQLAAFELELTQKADALEVDWNSLAEVERSSRSRYAQGSVHPDEVATEVAATRAALGEVGEVRGFVRRALRSLGAQLVGGSETEGDFAADAGALPVGLRESIVAAVGGTRELDGSGGRLWFRESPAVPRGEAALVRTDAAVGAVAQFVLDAALDGQLPEAHRPARRCGAIRTTAVSKRTTLLLVRYRFHLTLPSRTGDRQLVAEDARLLAFEGAPAQAMWLDEGAARALVNVQATENTAPEFAEANVERILVGLGELLPYLDDYGRRRAAELRDSHRRVRGASEQRLRGLRVEVQKPADILGVYVYLPVAVGSPSAAVTAGTSHAAAGGVA